MSPTILLTIFALLLVGLAGVLLYRRFLASYHFATVQSGVLYRDGFRTRQPFINAVRKSRCRVVVSLLDEQEIQRPPFRGERELLEARGVRLIHLPIKLGGWPTADDVRQFLSIVADPSNRPVLVHCAQGVRRTGMMVAAFQESSLGYDNQRTKSLIMRFGHSDRSINDVKRFIAVYEPQNQEMLEALPLSQE